jgi:hypothetical protein
VKDNSGSAGEKVGCPHCKKSVKVSKGGFLITHHIRRTRGFRTRCSGSGMAAGIIRKLEAFQLKRGERE